jgi:hypothetical protein
MTDANQRIEAALARLGEEHEPPAGWEQRVLDAVRAPPARRPWWHYAAPGLALAAAAVVALLVIRPPAAPLALHIERSRDNRMRGDDAALGDVLHIAVTGGSGRRAIWVYRNGASVLRCPGAPACRTADGGLAVDVTLDLVGTYKVVALGGIPDAMPAPTGGYDADTAAARQAGVGAADLREDTFNAM